MEQYFTDNEYLIRRKVLKLFGGAFHIYDMSGNVVAYSKLKAFKLKEDIRVYTGEDQSQELLSIAARHVIDFSAAYDVTDSLNGQRVGTLQRKGFKSMIRDEWVVLDAQGQEVGLITEDSMGMALLRRFFTNLIPQSFDCTVDGRVLCRFKQHFNPFVLKLTVGFHPKYEGSKLLLMAAGILLVAIEGRQDG